MRFRLDRTLALALVLLAGCQAGPNAANATVENDDQVASYALGRDIGTQLIAWGEHLDLSAMLAGVQDALDERESRVDDQRVTEARTSVGQLIQDEQKAKREAQADENLQEGLAFLAENGQRPEVVTLPSGLQYEVIEEGEGTRPRAEDQVKVHYTGTLVDGTKFDSSYDRNQPATFRVTGVIKGFSEGLMLMTEGSHYKLYIPGALGYGQAGNGPRIGPNATLIFEIELLEVIKP